MAVDVKTLRIGSHVSFNNKRVKITGILEDAISFDYTSDDKHLYFMPDAFELTLPIPITPTLLKELGFKPEICDILPDGEFWQITLNGWTVEVIYWGELSNSCDRNWSVRVDNSDCDGLGSGDVAYFHKLENIVYQCCGIELIQE